MHDEAVNSRPLLEPPVPEQAPQTDDHGDRLYSHVLVPIGVSRSDLPAIQLGLQIAAASEARLTLLYVAPLVNVAQLDAERSTSMLWFDAVDGLHPTRATAWSAHCGERAKIMEGLRRRLAAYLEREVPRCLRNQVEIRLECALGDVAEEIVRYATAKSTDLLILTSELSYWWLPVVPAEVHRVLQQVRGRVLVLRPAVADEAANPAALRSGA